MQAYRFEQELVQHCTPALCRIKPANLVCFSKREFPDFMEVFKHYQTELKRYGICMDLVCSCDKRWLVLVYQPKLLQKQLKQRSVAELLRRDGYPVGSLQVQLSHLRKRLVEGAEFPHEIGLFLGYPVEDVLAFQQHRGEGCKLCGYWKVYTDVEAAKRCFASFDACRAAWETALHNGKTVTQLLEMQSMRTA